MAAVLVRLGLASSGQFFCQSSGRKSWRFTMQPVADSMATHCAASGVVPRARQFDTTDCPTPIAAANLLTPPTMSIARSRGFMGPIITTVLRDVNTPVIHRSDEITPVETPKDRLVRLRKAIGMSQTQLAQLAKVSQGTIGNLESGVRGYGESIVSIAAVLGVTPEYLRCDKGAEPARPLAPPPPAPPRNFKDRHEVSESDWGVLQDVQLVMSEAQLRELREQAERIRRIAARQVAEMAEIGQAPPSERRRLADRLPGNLGAPVQSDYDQPERRKQGGQ